MASLNKVFLIGNLTKDPELRHTPSGASVADLRLAVNRRFKGTDGSFKDETCFVSVTAWGRQAETSQEYLSKGSPVLIEGRLKYDEWEKDGQKHSRVGVVAERVQFMGKPRQSGEQADGPASIQGSRPASDAGADGPGPGSGGDDEDLPF
ncbi:MAG: single-stranded DNA-binding protein [Lentisphaerales bacterium]|jgi:single-strand DNA-binding protein|nr:MAG: single-stranded DNA-binding protein [Lentisphaerales bacterium]